MLEVQPRPFLQQGDITTCTAPLPSLVGFGPERWKGEAKNSGVLLFNVPAMAQELPRVIEYARERSWQPCQQGWDQGERVALCTKQHKDKS